MKCYSTGNTAKHWILEKIHETAADRSFRVCDLACGYGSAWPDFLREHPQIAYFGLDTDAQEIARARRAFEGIATARVKVADGQTFADERGTFDAVTAFSALEHVVNLERFVRTALGLLKPGGRAYLNFDAGHFRSRRLKERLMVPVSQLLAKVGIEGPYMKEVDDRRLIQLIEQAQAKVVEHKKFNLASMKGLMHQNSSEEVFKSWCDFELRMNELLPPDKLDAAFWSTVIVAERL